MPDALLVEVALEVTTLDTLCNAASNGDENSGSNGQASSVVDGAVARLVLGRAGAAVARQPVLLVHIQVKVFHGIAKRQQRANHEQRSNGQRGDLDLLRSFVAIAQTKTHTHTHEINRLLEDTK